MRHSRAGLKIAAVKIAATVLLCPVIGQAAATAPKGIDLNQHYTDPATGKAVPNLTERRIGIRVLEPDLNYAKGAVVTDPEKVREMLAWDEAHKLQYAVEALDPDCAKCGPMTLGWVLEQAVLFRACDAGPGQPKSPQCTPDEQKAEDDPMTALGRQNFAKEVAADLKSKTPLTLTPKARDTLKLLVAARFAQVPTIVAQTWMMLDPDEQPVAFDK